MNEDIIKSLKDNIYFLEFRDYLISKINELNSIEGFDDRWTDELAGQEVRARAKAAKKLTDILKPFIASREKKEPTAEEVQKVKSKYAI